MIPNMILVVHHKSTIARDTVHLLYIDQVVDGLVKAAAQLEVFLASLARLESELGHAMVENIVGKRVRAINVAGRGRIIVIEANDAQTHAILLKVVLLQLTEHQGLRVD